MDRKLRLKAFTALLLTPIFFGAGIFIPARTLDYWQGWLFLVVFCGATAIQTLALMKNDPALLERRMRAGPTFEKRPAQRVIMIFVVFAFAAMLIVAGTDHRLGWSNLPIPVVLLGDVLIALSFVVFYIVCRENSFASATIEISEGQKVISTGPYGVVRHPMYAGALLTMLGIPFGLGSWYALGIVCTIAPFLYWRIVDEEKLLKETLPGYPEYCQQVKYRLIPGLY